MSQELKVEKELKDLIFSLTIDERTVLEESIKKDGCLDAIKVWNRDGEQVIVDGHNRYEICQKYNIPFDIKELKFDDIHDAKIWMIDIQRGRRNATRESLNMLSGLKLSEMKLKEWDRHSKDSLAVHFARLKEVNNVETRDKIAKEFHMSSSTVQRNEKYAGAIMNISKNTGLSLEKVIEVQRKSRSSKENIEELATLKPDEQKTIVKKIADANPGIVNLRCEILDVRPMFTPEQLKEIAKREASEPLISCSYVPHPLIDRLAICPCGCGYGVEASFVKKWYSKEEYDGVIR